jgi:hypothetical protein
MAHAFAPISGKPAFGTLKENLFQSDYLNRKKAKFAYCRTPSYCNKLKLANSYDLVNSYNLGLYSRNLETCNIIPINKGNLIMGQYTKLNLKNVCTVSSGAPPTKYCSYDNPCNPCQDNTGVVINPNASPATEISSNPFYFNATIDPLGELFGASQCGELNYTQNMVFYPPTKPLTLGFS